MYSIIWTLHRQTGVYLQGSTSNILVFIITTISISRARMSTCNHIIWFTVGANWKIEKKTLKLAFYFKRGCTYFTLKLMCSSSN